MKLNTLCSACLEQEHSSATEIILFHIKMEIQRLLVKLILKVLRSLKVLTFKDSFFLCMIVFLHNLLNKRISLRAIKIFPIHSIEMSGAVRLDQ